MRKVFYFLFCQIKVLAPSMQQWQYLLPIRTFPWVLQCRRLRHQHVTQIQLSPLSMDMLVYRLFHMVPWCPHSITWLLTAQPQKRSGLLVTRSIQRCHRFQHARQMAWLTKQITASVDREMDSKEIPTLPRMRLQHIQYEYLWLSHLPAEWVGQYMVSFDHDQISLLYSVIFH